MHRTQLSFADSWSGRRLLLDKVKKTDEGFFEGYASFAGVLRTWLIAYGIGCPVLLVTMKKRANN
jgi:hypothetical protein